MKYSGVFLFQCQPPKFFYQARYINCRHTIFCIISPFLELSLCKLNKGFESSRIILCEDVFFWQETLDLEVANTILTVIYHNLYVVCQTSTSVSLTTADVTRMPFASTRSGAFTATANSATTATEPTAPVRHPFISVQFSSDE